MKSNATLHSHIFNSSNSSLQCNFGTQFNVAQQKGVSELEKFYTIAICVLNVFLCLTALFGNLATLVAIWKTPSFHSPANTLLSSLAVSDFAVGLIVHPIFVASLSNCMYENTNTCTCYILFGVCNLASTFLCSASFFSTTAIGVDRLLALQLHLRYRSIVTKSRVSWVVIFAWVYSAFFSSLQVWFMSLYAMVLAPILVTLLVVNFVVYLRIYVVVRRHQAQIQQHQQQEEYGNIFSLKRFKKSALNTFLVYILLICCYAPFAVVISIRGWNVWSSTLGATGTIILLNSSLNPLLYCWRIREMRLAIKHIFCC